MPTALCSGSASVLCPRVRRRSVAPESRRNACDVLPWHDDASFSRSAPSSFAAVHAVGLDRSWLFWSVSFRFASRMKTIRAGVRFDDADQAEDLTRSSGPSVLVLESTPETRETAGGDTALATFPRSNAAFLLTLFRPAFSELRRQRAG